MHVSCHPDAAVGSASGIFPVLSIAGTDHALRSRSGYAAWLLRLPAVTLVKSRRGRWNARDAAGRVSSRACVPSRET